jgi:hypothetical protein
MRVKCIDNSVGDGTAKANIRLVLGQLYETEEGYGLSGFGNTRIKGVEGSFFTNRFKAVSADACEQCGEVH